MKTSCMCKIFYFVHTIHLVPILSVHSVRSLECELVQFGLRGRVSAIGLDV